MNEWMTTKDVFEEFGRGEKWLRNRRPEIEHRTEKITHGFRYLYLRSDVEKHHENNDARIRSIFRNSQLRSAARRNKERGRSRRIPEHLIPAFHDFFADVAMAWARKKVAQRAE